ncbi:uncharacterized protein A1O9_10821, partial [Exophiala aquamarina CBS 119918]
DPSYVDQDPNLNFDQRLEKRTPPLGIYLCTHSNWTGECGWQALQNNVCLDFPWDAAISMGPAAGTQCKIYYGRKCGGGDRTDGTLTYPGTNNLAKLYSNSKKPESYKCRKCPDGQP